MTKVEYKESLRPHTRALRQLVTDLDFFLEDIGPINVFSISSRLKQYGSALRKSRRLGIPLQDLQDLAGIRIVVATSHEADVLARFFRREDVSKDLQIESEENLSREDGYRAKHIVVVVQPRYTRSAYPARIEVQLMTVMQHAFNFMSRAWVYKSETRLSERWHSDFLELARTLHRLDRLANVLHAEVMDSASTLCDAAVLTPMSYLRLVRTVFGEDVPLDDAVDSCRLMVDIGCRTNGAARAFLEDGRVEELRQRFQTSLSRVARAWRDTVDQMPRHDFWMMFGTRYEATLAMLLEEDRAHEPEHS